MFDIQQNFFFHFINFRHMLFVIITNLRCLCIFQTFEQFFLKNQCLRDTISCRKNNSIFFIYDFIFSLKNFFEKNLKKKYFDHVVNVIVVCIFRYAQSACSIILLIIYITSQILFQNLILFFRLFIRLRMKRCVITQFHL